MVRAATHMGTCQLCGREQKLPGGRLSKHGYTVQWSMFLGTCPGADGLPFEQSVDLIEAAIARAQAIAAALITSAVALEADIEPDYVWVHQYRAPTWQNRKGGYEWRKLAAEEIQVEPRETGEYTLYSPTYNGPNGRRERVLGGAGFTRNLHAAYHEQNVRRATAFRSEAADYEQYVQWQRNRIANWQPKDLKPVMA